MVRGDVPGPSVVDRAGSSSERVPDARALGAVTRRTLNLVGRGRRAPDEV